LVMVVFIVINNSGKSNKRESVINDIRQASDTARIAVDGYIQCLKSPNSPGNIECQARSLEQIRLIKGEVHLPEARKTLATLVKKLEALESQ
jgi:hypothetical protein